MNRFLGGAGGGGADGMSGGGRNTDLTQENLSELPSVSCYSPMGKFVLFQLLKNLKDKYLVYYWC